METKAKLPKKLLSMFLAMLMIFSACYVGIDGAYTAYAADGSAYTHAQVKALIDKAIDLGDGKYYSQQSSKDTTDYPSSKGDNGEILAAAEAIFDYAVKTYRTGKTATDAVNTTQALLDAFVAEFGPDYPSNTTENTKKANAALALVTDVLNPAGTTVYTVDNKVQGTIKTENSSSWTVVNVGVDPVRSEGDHANEDWIQSNYSTAVKAVVKTVSFEINLEEYLLGFTSISDLPATIIRGVDYTYAHAIGKQANTVNKEEGNWRKKYYVSTTTPYSWNYMSGKPVRIITKDKTTKKQLLAFEKFFSPEALAMTVEQLIALKPAKLAELLTDAKGYWEAIQTAFSQNIIEHFGMKYDDIEAFVERVEFASKVVSGKNAIDNLNSSINSEYDSTKYSQMASLYAKATGAVEGVKAIEPDVLDYIIDEDKLDYAEEYETAEELLKDADSYIATLYADMMKQHFIDKTNGMKADLDEYEGKLDKDDFKTPTDLEVEALLARVNSANNVVNNTYYADKDYYKEYYSEKKYSETQTLKEAWEAFVPDVREVAEVRDLKGVVTDYYNYFMPILDTNLIVDLTDEQAMDYYTGMADKLTELENLYDDIAAEWNTTVADNIFTVDGALLQDRVDDADDGALLVLKNNLIARVEADIDGICTMNGKISTGADVNFDNFAEIKTELSSFNKLLYDFVYENGWLTQTYIDKYAQWDQLLGKYQAFTKTNGYSAFDESFTYADANGNYAERPAKQLVTVEGEDENGNPISYETYIYANDIAREGADDNYVVNATNLTKTATNLDGFLASRDFGALLGFVNEETEEAATLGEYVNQMINNMLFTDELINSLITMLYPMVCDMLETELPKALADLGAPNDPGASAAIDVGSLVDALGGTLNIYIDDDEKTKDDKPDQNGRKQKYLYEVFEEVELFIYPRSFAKYLNMNNPAEFKVGNELYDALIAADRNWKYFELKEDLLDEEGNVKKEAGEIHIDYQWNINGDRDNFLDAITYILDSLLPLLRVLMTGVDFSEQIQQAAYVWGYVDVPILGDQQLGGWGILTLGINCYTKDTLDTDNPVKFRLWNDLIVPLFQVLGVTGDLSLDQYFTAEQLVDKLLKTLLTRVDEILAHPLDSILSILPNLVYFLSMDSVQEALDNLNIQINLGIGVDINSDDSGLVGDIVGLFNLDNITTFDFGLKVADLINDKGGLYGLLGFEISDLNSLLGMVVPMLGIDGLTLPEIKQKEIIFCSDWSTRADGSVNLVANKADLIYWFLNFIVEVIADGKLLNALLGGDISLGEGTEGEENKELDPNIKALIEKLVKQFTENPDQAVAALVELLNPQEYELQSMDWVESQYNYGEPVIEGVNAMSALYLNYGTDWTEDMANKLVDDIDELLPQILDMAGVELDAESIGALLQEKVDGIFTNETVTKLVKILGGLGDSTSAVIEDLVKNQIGIDITSWFVAFGYLFPEGTWKEDAEVIRPGTTYYKNDFGVEGILNEDGSISWFYRNTPLLDGMADTFISIVVSLFRPAKLLVDFLFAGEDISAFTGAVTIKGYETFDTTLGLLLDVLGVQNLPTQADFNADSMGALANTLYAVHNWLHALTSSEDMVAQLLEIIPDLFYYIESNGLSVLLHNLLMPVWVLIDTVRPLLDVNVDGLLSMIVSEILNGNEFNVDSILDYVMTGHYNMEGENYKPVHIELKNLRLSDIIAAFDGFLGTNLATSGLVEIGVNGFCSGIVDNKTTVTAADAITLLVNGLLDCLEQPSATEGLTNGAVICNFVQKMLVDKAIADGKPASEVIDIPALYASIMKIFKGVEVEYQTPDWGYLTKGYNLFDLTAPTPTIAYLDYTTDWTQDSAKEVYDSLDEILEMVLPMIIEEEGGTLATLINGILNEKVYSDELLTSLVETVVNLLADFNSFFGLVDGLLGTSVEDWFADDFCQLQNVINEETGEVELDENGEIVQKWVCVKNFGIDEAAEDEKAEKFIDALGTVLAPANALLSWLFFGDSYEFFTATEKVEHEDGSYEFVEKEGAIITLNGGRGYAKGLAPILSALGLNMKVESAYLNADGTYDSIAAVKDIFREILGLINKLATSEDAVKLVFDLLPNLIYFINADGLVSSVNNILAPVDAIAKNLSPIINDDGTEFSIAGLINDAIPVEGLDIGALTMENILNLVISLVEGLNIPENIRLILGNLYVGNLKAFTGADGNAAYRLDVAGYEGDVLTIVLSLAIDLFNCNEKLFAELLDKTGKDGATVYAAIKRVIAGFEVELEEINWAYMYEDIEGGATAVEQLKTNGFPAPEFAYLDYSTDWTGKTAADIYAALDEILAMVLPMVLEDNQNLKTIVEGILNDNVYSDAVLNSLVEMIVNAIGDFQGAIGAVDALLDTDIESWFDFCAKDEEGNLLKNTEGKYYVAPGTFGIDAAETTAEKAEKFVEAVGDVLEPANALLAWLFFGEDYTFFNGSDGSVLITLNGGRGYAYAIAPILEALGLEMKAESAYEIKDAEGKVTGYNVALAVEDILNAVLGLVAKLDDYKYVVEFVFKLLPNLIYFINADGLKTSVNNLIAPVNDLFKTISVFFDEKMAGKDIGELINGLLPADLGLDITNLTTDALLALAENYGVVFTEGNVDLAEVIKGFYVGTAVEYDAANGQKAFKVDITDAEHDVLTVILGFAIDLFKLNKDLFAGLLPDGSYDQIITLINGIIVTYNQINWAYMYEDDAEDVEDGKTALQKLDANGFPEKTIDKLGYTKDWTEETADGVYAALDPLADMLLPELLGEGSLLDLLMGVLNDEVFTDKTANALIELIVNAICGLDDTIITIIQSADSILGADVSVWFSMCDYNEETGKYECNVKWGIDGATDPKAKFIEAVKTVISPANDLLSWLFFADSYTFFNGETKQELITINGGEGYANALVPLLEAIGCTMQPKSAFYSEETEKYDVGAAIESILDSVLDFAAEVSANPVEEVFNLLPNLIYFINAGGVKAVVNNLLAPVDSVLNSIKGLVGEISIGKLLYDAVGFDVSEITTATLLQIARDNGVEISEEIEKLVCELAVGTPKAYDSVSGLDKPAYRVDITGAEGEILTIILALALDIFTTNKVLFSDLLGEAEYEAVIKLISGAASGVNWEYKEIDWGYMYEGEELADRLEALANNNGKLPNYPANSTAANYLLYGNNWNKETAVYVNQVIDAVVAGIMEDTSLGQMLDNAIANGLYQDDILNSLLESVVGLIVDYAEIIENAGVLLGAESISKWFYDEKTGEGYVKIVDGEAVCVHDFGIDEAKTNDEKRTLFVEAFVDVLEPAYRLLAWLLFGEDFEFLNGTTGAPLITLTGGQGYAKGFAPLLEALGATMPGVDGTYVNGKSGIKPASAYYDENGVLDMETAVRDIFSALADWLYKICGDLQNPGELGTIGAMLELLPNVIYNINAGTLKAVVSNLLLPVEEILGHLEAFGLEVDFETLVEIGGQPLNIKDIDWYDIFDIVASLVNLYWPPEIEEFLATLYVGNAVAYDSASGETGYYMTYNPADTDENYLISGREDMITILISFVVDGALDPRNEAQLTDWLGADVYKVIYKYLSKDITPVEMQKFDWQLTEFAGTGEVLSPVTLGAVINSEFYGTLYTREMGQYIEKWLPSFVDTMIVLLGVQAEDGTNFEGLEDILNDLIGTSLYTKANLQAILDAIKGLIPTLKEELGAELFDVIVNVLDKALGIDLTYFDTYTIADLADGDREAFVNGLVNMFEPLEPILKWLLTGEDLIALFHTANGDDAVVIEGAEGYAYGIIPLLEAFDYEGNILTPEEFEAQADDTAAMLKNVLNPILNVVDKVLADPVNEIFNVLPGIIYFLNSNGLDTVIRNVLNAVLVVLKNIEPLTDGLTVEDIYEMIGFNAAEINIDTLLDELLQGLAEDTGFQLADVAMEAIKELTLGEVISFTSKNGEQAYTMKYVTGADRVDMVTVVLRTALTFISIPENVVALEAMLEGSLDGDGYKFVCSLLENFSQMAASEGGMDEIMYTVYHIFYAANVAAHSTEDWLAEFNGDYSFLNQLFATSDLAFLRQLEASLGDLLNKYTGDIIDDDEIVPNGFIAFFQKIAEFFKKIGEFFANLFK